MILKKQDIEILCNTTNGGLKNQAKSNRAKVELAAPKGNDQMKSLTRPGRARNGETMLLFDQSSNLQATMKEQTRELHAWRRMDDANLGWKSDLMMILDVPNNLRDGGTSRSNGIAGMIPLDFSGERLHRDNQEEVTEVGGAAVEAQWRSSRP